MKITLLCAGVILFLICLHTTVITGDPNSETDTEGKEEKEIDFYKKKIATKTELLLSSKERLAALEKRCGLTGFSDLRKRREILDPYSVHEYKRQLKLIFMKLAITEFKIKQTTAACEKEKKLDKSSSARKEDEPRKSDKESNAKKGTFTDELNRLLRTGSSGLDTEAAKSVNSARASKEDELIKKGTFTDEINRLLRAESSGKSTATDRNSIKAKKPTGTGDDVHIIMSMTTMNGSPGQELINPGNLTEQEKQHSSIADSIMSFFNSIPEKLKKLFPKAKADNANTTNATKRLSRQTEESKIQDSDQLSLFMRDKRQAEKPPLPPWKVHVHRKVRPQESANLAEYHTQQKLMNEIMKIKLQCGVLGGRFTRDSESTNFYGSESFVDGDTVDSGDGFFQDETHGTDSAFVQEEDVLDSDEMFGSSETSEPQPTFVDSDDSFHSDETLDSNDEFESSEMYGPDERSSREEKENDNSEFANVRPKFKVEPKVMKQFEDDLRDAIRVDTANLKKRRTWVERELKKMKEFEKTDKCKLTDGFKSRLRRNLEAEGASEKTKPVQRCMLGSCAPDLLILLKEYYTLGAKVSQERAMLKCKTRQPKTLTILEVELPERLHRRYKRETMHQVNDLEDIQRNLDFMKMKYNLVKWQQEDPCKRMLDTTTLRIRINKRRKRNVMHMQQNVGETFPEERMTNPGVFGLEEPAEDEFVVEELAEAGNFPSEMEEEDDILNDNGIPMFEEDLKPFWKVETSSYLNDENEVLEHYHDIQLIDENCRRRRRRDLGTPNTGVQDTNISKVLEGEWLSQLQAVRAMQWLNEDLKARQDENKADQLRLQITELKDQIKLMKAGCPANLRPKRSVDFDSWLLEEPSFDIEEANIGGWPEWEADESQEEEPFLYVEEENIFSDGKSPFEFHSQFKMTTHKYHVLLPMLEEDVREMCRKQHRRKRQTPPNPQSQPNNEDNSKKQLVIAIVIRLKTLQEKEDTVLRFIQQGRESEIKSLEAMAEKLEIDLKNLRIRCFPMTAQGAEPERIKKRSTRREADLVETYAGPRKKTVTSARREDDGKHRKMDIDIRTRVQTKLGPWRKKTAHAGPRKKSPLAVFPGQKRKSLHVHAGSQEKMPRLIIAKKPVPVYSSSPKKSHPIGYTVLQKKTKTKAGKKQARISYTEEEEAETPDSSAGSTQDQDAEAPTARMGSMQDGNAENATARMGSMNATARMGSMNEHVKKIKKKTMSGWEKFVKWLKSIFSKKKKKKSKSEFPKKYTKAQKRKIKKEFYAAMKYKRARTGKKTHVDKEYKEKIYDRLKNAKAVLRQKEKRSASEPKKKDAKEKKKSSSGKTKASDQKKKAAPGKTKASDQKKKAAPGKTKASDQKKKAAPGKTKASDQKKKAAPGKTKASDQKKNATPGQKKKATDKKKKATPEKKKAAPKPKKKPPPPPPPTPEPEKKPTPPPAE